jgi:hypothetical protein
MIFKAILVTPMMVFACWALSSAARAATCSNASRSGTYRFPHSGTAGDGTPILGLSDPSQLHFRLSQADPCNDEPDIFRSRLLRAFGRAGFLRFQALASALEQEPRDAVSSRREPRHIETTQLGSAECQASAIMAYARCGHRPHHRAEQRTIRASSSWLRERSK